MSKFDDDFEDYMASHSYLMYKTVFEDFFNEIKRLRERVKQLEKITHEDP